MKSSDPIGDVRETVGMLESALEDLYQAHSPQSVDDLVGLLIVLQEFQKSLSAHVSSCESVILGLMEGKQQETAHGVIESVTSSNKTTWDAPMLLSVLAREAYDRRGVDRETGELESPLTAITKAIIDCCAVSYFRLGALEHYEIDGRKYREVEWGRKRVKIIKTAPSQDP